MLRSSGGATSVESDHGSTIGSRTSVPAMSPSTITASTGCGSVRASSAAPAAPTDALVEASTIERC